MWKSGTMAGLNVCKILLVLGVLTRHGFGATLDLTVTPTKTSQLSPEDVYISCRPGTSFQAMSIFLIKITNSGNSLPVASIYHNQNAVVYNPSTRMSGIKATGHIDDDALNESFLTIKLEDPTYQQSGSYECELTYLDVKGRTQVAKASGDVKVMKPDILSVDRVIDDLREDLESVTKELRETKAETSSTRKSMKALTQKLRETKAETSSTRKSMKALTQKLRETKAETSSTRKSLKTLTQKLRETKAETSSTRKSLKALTQELRETKAKLQKKKEIKCVDESWTQVDHFVCYKAHTTVMSWHKAKEFCHKEGGSLVRINSGFHNAMARSVAQSAGITHNAYWMGLSDIAEEGKFVFDEGTDILSYTNWGTGQPDNFSGKQDCAAHWVVSDYWSDRECERFHHIVCQASTRSEDFW